LRSLKVSREKQARAQAPRWMPGLLPEKQNEDVKSFQPGFLFDG
jgi:hypothetical protein